MDASCTPQAGPPRYGEKVRQKTVLMLPSTDHRALWVAAVLHRVESWLEEKTCAHAPIEHRWPRPTASAPPQTLGRLAEAFLHVHPPLQHVADRPLPQAVVHNTHLRRLPRLDRERKPARVRAVPGATVGGAQQQVPQPATHTARIPARVL